MQSSSRKVSGLGINSMVECLMWKALDLIFGGRVEIILLHTFPHFFSPPTPFPLFKFVVIVVVKMPDKLYILIF